MSAAPRPGLALALALASLAPACSVRRLAIQELGAGLAEGSGTFASDPDPELVRDALPFALKLMESLLAEDPDNPDLLLACSSGFAQYAYGFVQQEADEVEATDLARAEELRARARGLFLRAREHGLHALDLRHPGFVARLRADPTGGAAELETDDVELAFWSGGAWGAAIGLATDQPALVAELPAVHALFERCLALDETFDRGALHAAWIVLEPSRIGVPGDPLERSEAHYRRAVELSGGLLPGPHVAYAEVVCVKRQDAAAFRAALEQALQVDPDAVPEERTSTLILQRRARWLLARIDDLILEALPAEGSAP